MKLLKETYVGRAAVLDVKSRTDLKQFVQSIINSDASNSITDNPSEQK